MIHTHTLTLVHWSETWLINHSFYIGQIVPTTFPVGVGRLPWNMCYTRIIIPGSHGSEQVCPPHTISPWWYGEWRTSALHLSTSVLHSPSITQVTAGTPYTTHKHIASSGINTITHIASNTQWPQYHYTHIPLTSPPLSRPAALKEITNLYYITSNSD